MKKLTGPNPTRVHKELVSDSKLVSNLHIKRTSPYRESHRFTTI